jgi:hypothetical protein
MCRETRPARMSIWEVIGMAAIPIEPSAAELAEHHAQEAQRLLEGRLGIITNYVKAQVHATLGVYYATRQSADD